MSDILIIVSLIGGLILLFVGAEGLVRGSSAIALRLGISPLVIGLTVVAFGTSAPELLVSVKSSLEGNSDIAIGNVIGSNICNIALILGVSALINPMIVKAQVVKREIPIMIGVTVLLILMLLNNNISRLEGIILTAGIIIYTVISIYLSKKERDPEVILEFQEELGKKPVGLLISSILVVVGLALLIFGANIFVNGAVSAAERMGVSNAVIGLTVVAFGTSLPELITSIVAGIKKEGDIAIGNIVGSNVFNILSILGITAVIKPITSYGISYVDLSIMLLTAVIILPLSYSGFKINRWEGAFLFIGYIAYFIYLLP